MSDYKIADISLSASGKDRVDWARHNRPVLQAIRKRLAVEQPFKGLKIGICLHVEAKSAVWVETLMAGGADVAVFAKGLVGFPDTQSFHFRVKVSYLVSN